MSKIAVTSFFTESYKKLALITIPVMDEWCSKHGYDFYPYCLKDSEGFHFKKTHHVRELLDKDYDIVMAMECDILVTNLGYTIEDFIDDHHDMFITDDINNINFGCFIAKNTQYTKDLLDWVDKSSHKYGDEQNFFETYRNHKTRICRHPCFNSIPYNPYYLPSCGKIGYKDGDEVEIPTLEQGLWVKGKSFNMHLPGIPLEKRVEIFQNHLKDIIYE